MVKKAKKFDTSPILAFFRSFREENGHPPRQANVFK